MKNSNANHKTFVNLPAFESGVWTETQYGMRYPDGGILWETEPSLTASTHFKNLVDDDGPAAQKWRTTLEHRAYGMSLDPTDYINGHQLIKRTVVVAITDREDV